MQAYEKSQVHQRKRQEQQDADDCCTDETDVANVFFELANSPLISYRINDTMDIRIRQDVEACGEHTGGIVWETSFLLLNYLRSLKMGDGTTNQSKYPCGKRLVEVGAGCGMLGLGIYHSKLAKQVVMTETDQVLANLKENMAANFKKGKKRTKKGAESNVDRLRACALDWTRCEEDCQKAGIDPHSADMIVGTDVVFSMRFVDPLLKTLRYLAKDTCTILLCLQERCKDSHELLLSRAKYHDLSVKDISVEVTSIPSCEWGKDLECCVLKMQVMSRPPTCGDSIPSIKNKRKRKHAGV